jgi:hypothetical protein
MRRDKRGIQRFTHICPCSGTETAHPPESDRIRIIKHEAVPKCGSYEGTSFFLLTARPRS